MSQKKLVVLCVVVVLALAIANIYYAAVGVQTGNWFTVVFNSLAAILCLAVAAYWVFMFYKWKKTQEADTTSDM